MHKALINPHDFLRYGKGYAAITCLVKAIFRIDAEELAIMESKICHGCGDCISNCSAKAITLKNN